MVEVLIACSDVAALDGAVMVARQEAVNFSRYDRIGWGWSFNEGAFRYFVRRTKNGLSVRQLRDKP